VPFLQLPLLFDAAVLAAEVAAIGEDAWRPHPQGYPGNSMLPLVAVGGDPDNEAFAGRMAATSYLARCPYLTQVMSNLGVVLGRSRLMRLPGHAEVSVHVDQGYYWMERVRVHVPIVTQDTVRFDCGDASVNMAAGECWIFDTWRPHRVINDAEASRIHLVVDTVGGDGFWPLTSRGRTHDAPRGAGWQPRKVSPGEPADALAYESTNVPLVMTPWELNAQLTLLFAEVLPDPTLGVVRQMANHLVRTWRSLWAEYGDAKQGHAHYRAVLDRFIEEVKVPAESLLLRNDLRWYGAMVTSLGKAAAVGGRSNSLVGDYGVADRA